jgi:PsbP-like protein
LVIEVGNNNKLLLSVSIPIKIAFILFASTIIHHQQEEALAQTNDDDNNNFKAYDNPTYGISMQYPSDWIKIEPSQISHESSFNIIVGFYSKKVVQTHFLLPLA